MIENAVLAEPVAVQPITVHCNRFPSGNSSLWTPEQARKAAQASVIARQAKKTAPQAKPEPKQAKPENRLEADKDWFRLQSLSRVRKQIKAISSQLDDEIVAEQAKARCQCGKWCELPLPDSRRIKELADSIARLSEIERQLAGRPLPGSYKPAPIRSRRDTGQVEPIEPG